jgi:hypothetical protein
MLMVEVVALLVVVAVTAIVEVAVAVSMVALVVGLMAALRVFAPRQYKHAQAKVQYVPGPHDNA